MGKSNDGRRDGLTFDAYNPIGDGPCRVQISLDRLRAVAKRGAGAILECRNIVPHILAHPTAIFEGLRRDEEEDRWGYGWRCYCGLPTVAYRTNGTEINPYPRQVYLVFVNDGFIAYNWRWEYGDPEDLELPADHPARFTRRLR